MHYGEDLKLGLADTIRENIGQPWYDKFARSFDSARVPEMRLLTQGVRDFANATDYAACCSRVVGGNVIMDSGKIFERGPRPPNAH